MDCVMVLDDFHIEPTIASKWGEFRAKLIKELTRFSFRVHADQTVKIFVRTSGMRFNAATNEAETVDDAIAGILAARQAQPK
jgi:hypothetical protein